VNAPQIVPEIDRSRFLGGSDAAAVMGLSPWTTPLELWMLKTGRKAREVPDAQRQRIYDRGHRLEPFIRDMVIDKLRERGLEVELLEINARYVDPEHPFLSCEIDFELRLSGALEIGGVEWVFQGEHINCDAKSVTGFARKKWGEEDSEDVPIEYAVQFMHGLMITGRRFCLVAALRSFDDVDIFWTVRDEETITGMRPKLVSFWLDHVRADVSPDTMTFSDIKALFPLDNGLDVEATQEVADKVAQLRTIKAQLKEWESAEEALTFEIADYISPHTRLMFQGQPLMTWKGQNDTRVDQTRLKAEDPDTYHRFSRTKVVRVLRFSTPKKGI
jgi:predicted phage-related endonuclease